MGHLHFILRAARSFWKVLTGACYGLIHNFFWGGGCELFLKFFIEFVTLLLFLAARHVGS